MIVTLTDRNLEEIITLSLSILKKDGIIAYPTETFYGLGARYNSEAALSRLYEIKMRPKEKAMPLIIGRLEHLSLLTNNINPIAQQLIEKYWPGPLTLVFDAIPNLSKYVVSENRVAVRMPGESFALRLVTASDFPITATSANISGMPPADNATIVKAYFQDRLDLIIDGGKTRGGMPSTIVDITEGKIKILRKGAIEII